MSRYYAFCVHTYIFILSQRWYMNNILLLFLESHRWICTPGCLFKKKLGVCYPDSPEFIDLDYMKLNQLTITVNLDLGVIYQNNQSIKSFFNQEENNENFR